VEGTCDVSSLRENTSTCSGLILRDFDETCRVSSLREIEGCTEPLGETDVICTSKSPLRENARSFGETVKGHVVYCPEGTVKEHVSVSSLRRTGNVCQISIRKL
jgi:hypothetical protein